MVNESKSILFFNATSKLEWSRFRINELAKRKREYEASNPIELKHSETEIIIEREKSYPVDMSLILGDAIHNLRTSLDLLASELVQINNKNVKDVYFPFAKNSVDLERQIKIKHFDRAGVDSVELLRKISPHGEGDNYLYGLHKLDILDKHQLILPVISALEISNFCLNGPTGKLVAQINIIGDGFSVSAFPEDSATWDSVVSTMVFSDNVPKVFIRQPIIEILEKLYSTIAGIIDSFRKIHISKN